MSAIHGTMAETMWNVLHDYTLGEQPVNQLDVCFSGTPNATIASRLTREQHVCVRGRNRTPLDGALDR